ncbi:unnamed protein product [Somion occarium]|uniref:ARID domain-containing protein n=1 Tax=Somion occarium TaxID=3059160 RepID=A0ABP1E7T4_9APHY
MNESSSQVGTFCFRFGDLSTSRVDLEVERVFALAPITITAAEASSAEPQSINLPPAQATMVQNELQGSQGMPNLNDPNNQWMPGTPQDPPFITLGIFVQRAVEPLPPAAFAAAYSGYLNKMPAEKRTPYMEGRLVDLHLLHTEIIKAGGPHNIADAYGRPLDDCWQILAAKLGFVQFPGNDRELPMSSPLHGVMLQHFYADYLLGFDVAYIRTCLVNNGTSQLGVKGANSAGGQVNGNMDMHPMQGSSSEGQAVPTGVPTHNPQAIFTIAGSRDPKKIQELLMLAQLPMDELKARNIPEELIKKIAVHGPYLQQWVQYQRQFNNRIRSAQSGQSSAGMSQPPRPTMVPPTMPGQVPQQGQMSNHNARPEDGMAGTWAGQQPNQAPSLQAANAWDRPPTQVIQNISMITSLQRGREELEKCEQRHQSIAQSLQLAIQRQHQVASLREGNEVLYQQHMPRLTAQIGLMRMMIARIDNLRLLLQARIQQLQQQEHQQGDISTPAVSDTSNLDATLSGLEDELERLNM